MSITISVHKSIFKSISTHKLKIKQVSKTIKNQLLTPYPQMGMVWYCFLHPAIVTLQKLDHIIIPRLIQFDDVQSLIIIVEQCCAKKRQITAIEIKT